MKKKNHNPAPHELPGFKGYTLSQLRYQRTVTLLKSEYTKDRISEDLDRARKLTPFTSQGKKGIGRNIGGFAGKFITGLSFIDYAMIGLSVFGTVRKVFGFFKTPFNKKC